MRGMMASVCSLFLTLLLTGACASVSPSGAQPVAPCPPPWLRFGQRCFAFYPVWSTWSTANTLCSQTDSTLVSLHTPEERQFVSRLANTTTPVWLGEHQAHQFGSWFRSDHSPFRISGWIGQSMGARACTGMTPKSGELHSAPCGELKFYICSTRLSSSSAVVLSSRKPVQPGFVHGVSLLDVVWGYSDSLAEEILHSCSFLTALRSHRLTERCYTSFTQQEALYLHRVSSTLEVLMTRLQETDSMRSLLQDTVIHYSSRNQSLLTSPSPQWLHFSLQTFHSVVLEEPAYWFVALSARASLRNFLFGELFLHKAKPHRVSGSVADSLYQMWTNDSLKETVWIHRYRKVIEEHQDQMDVFKAINIFRQHMMNEKRLFKAVTCAVENDE